MVVLLDSLSPINIEIHRRAKVYRVFRLFATRSRAWRIVVGRVDVNWRRRARYLEVIDEANGYVAPQEGC